MKRLKEQDKVGTTKDVNELSKKELEKYQKKLDKILAKKYPWYQLWTVTAFGLVQDLFIGFLYNILRIFGLQFLLGRRYETPVMLRHKDLWRNKAKTYYPFGPFGYVDTYLIQRKIYHNNWMFNGILDVNNSYFSNIILTPELKMFDLPDGVLTDGMRRSNFFKYRYDKEVSRTSWMTLGEFYKGRVSGFDPIKFNSTTDIRVYAQFWPDLVFKTEEERDLILFNNKHNVKMKLAPKKKKENKLKSEKKKVEKKKKAKSKQSKK